MDIPDSISVMIRRLSATALLLLAGAAWSGQQDALDAAELVARYPKGSIDSLEKADQALADVSRARKAIKARYDQQEQACLPNFFATSCIDAAKEKQRLDLARLRPVELESNGYKRQARAEKRDADIQERREKAEAKRLETESIPAAQSRVPTPASKAEPAAGTQEDRSTAHEARIRALQAKEQAEAPRRAERVEAYERKQQESIKRQEEVARRKAEKEAKRRAKEQAAEAAAGAVVRP